MELKTYNLKWYGINYKLAPVVSNYVNNGSLAVELYVVKRGKIVEPFADLTKNLTFEKRKNQNCQFVDVNNFNFAIHWLIDNEIANPTGYFATSGYCVYPECEFDLEKLNILEEE